MIRPKQEAPGFEAAVAVSIRDETDVAYARHRARQLAEQIGLRSAKIYRFVTAVSELAHNLHFHTHLGGTIRLAALNEGGRVGVEVVSEDQGPGIPNIDLAMQDGFSTNRGLGGGLPGVRRLMDEFSIRSEVGVGTRVAARLWRP